MKLFRLEYTELPGLSEGLLAFMAEYFQEHDTGGEGIIARIDNEIVADMILFFENENDKRIQELLDWWKQFQCVPEEGFDIQILTGA